MPLERVNDIKGGDGLALGVFGVGDSVTNDAFEEGFEHASGLLVDHGGDSLDATSSSETSDGGLSYALDVVA